MSIKTIGLEEKIRFMILEYVHINVPFYVHVNRITGTCIV